MNALAQTNILVGTCFLVVAMLAVSSPVLSDDEIHKFIPKSELLGAQAARGELTTEALQAAESALSELRKRKLNLTDFRSVAVQEAGSSFHVLFSNRELGSTVTGSPGEPRPVIVRVNRKSFKVLGSYQYKQDEE